MTGQPDAPDALGLLQTHYVEIEGFRYIRSLSYCQLIILSTLY
jgi:hypothetical protein